MGMDNVMQGIEIQQNTHKNQSVENIPYSIPEWNLIMLIVSPIHNSGMEFDDVNCFPQKVRYFTAREPISTYDNNYKQRLNINKPSNMCLGECNGATTKGHTAG